MCLITQITWKLEYIWIFKVTCKVMWLTSTYSMCTVDGIDILRNWEEVKVSNYCTSGLQNFRDETLVQVV